MPEKVIGILGGMGPEATVDFFHKVVTLTPAKRDQDHLRIIIDNNPKIPDRTEAILKRDKSLFLMLLETAENLERAGADFIAIPCNTVHYFYEDLAREISIPILHVIREVIYAVNTALPGCKGVGLIATTGTIASNLYQKEFRKIGIEVIVPNSQSQAEVMDAILKIKASHEKDKARKELIKAAYLLIERKVEALILGCTDVSLVFGARDFAVPVFDSTAVLAEVTVKSARSETISSY